jgi:hypothetical protein
MVGDECQDEIFLLFRVDKMAVCIIVPLDGTDIVDVKVDCPSSARIQKNREFLSG